MATIGFIGLGNMGLPMARNLIKAGHRVRAFDVNTAAVDKAKESGATPTASAAATAEAAAAVITMLPAGEHAREVYLGVGGVLSAARPETLLIDCSTIDVKTARELHAKAKAAGLTMADAPVSGGVAGAEAATLTFMVGGSERAFAAAEPILCVMGKAVINAGGPGNGQAAKICNNLILGSSMIAVCEAFVLAERLGLSAHKLFAISSKSSGQCWSLTSYCPAPGPLPSSPANRDYRPGFTAAMMLKDLRLALGSAADAGADTPLTRAAAALYEAFINRGEGGTDFSGIIRMLRASTSR
jgi:3-hydroxyisobutyrate dehydrogenase